MSDKSYVTLEQRACVVCVSTYDTGALLLDRRLRETFEHHTVTGWGMCPECKKQKDDGYVALVEVGNEPRPAIKPSEANRTGRILHIRIEVFERVFDAPPPERGVCFVNSETCDALEKMAGGAS
jgi:hypothetical protein